MPIKAYVRSKLETDKEKKLLDEIVASNNIKVPEDFTVPEVSEEQMQEMMKKQQEQMPPMEMSPEGESGQAPPPAARNPNANTSNSASNAARPAPRKN